VIAELIVARMLASPGGIEFSGDAAGCSADEHLAFVFGKDAGWVDLLSKACVNGFAGGSVAAVAGVLVTVWFGIERDAYVAGRDQYILTITETAPPPGQAAAPRLSRGYAARPQPGVHRLRRAAGGPGGTAGGRAGGGDRGAWPGWGGQVPARAGIRLPGTRLGPVPGSRAGVPTRR
jgi:hypothetical protein